MFIDHKALQLTELSACILFHCCTHNHFIVYTCIHDWKMNILDLQRVICFVLFENKKPVWEKGRETLSHPEITCSLFAPYPVWLRSLVTTVPCMGSSLSLSVSVCLSLFFSSSIHVTWERNQELQGQGLKVKRNKTIPLSAACCLRDQRRVRDKSLKSSDHLCMVVCFSVCVGVQRRGVGFWHITAPSCPLCPLLSLTNCYISAGNRIQLLQIREWHCIPQALTSKPISGRDSAKRRFVPLSRWDEKKPQC